MPDAPPPAPTPLAPAPRKPKRHPLRRFKPTHRAHRADAVPGTVDRRPQDVLLRPMRPPGS